ncbi:piezo-type mechanosensitive ion channel component 1-like isoform X1 [Polyodon spathula]|uniref:piezo-type mechanosensitive ion channel component 1-like isoform X1 n=1 Tax=Polyodon spathula TaxID=7913 RepID=UPI001B7F12C8|nr:piezo-type mechanosensitive ion channel component 1-like isoform X1 [Polyodon spathula]
MEPHVLCGLLYWLLLPLCLLAACLFRYNALSLVYLLYLLLLPWFPGPSERTIRGHTGRFIKALFGTSIFFLLGHVVFQICLHTVPGLDDILGHNCSMWVTLSRHVGVTRLPLDDLSNASRLLAPDVGISVVSLVTLCLSVRLLKRRGVTPGETVETEPLKQGEPAEGVGEEESEEDEEEDGEAANYEEEEERERRNVEEDSLEGEQPLANRAALLAAQLRVTALKFLKNVGKILAIALLGLAGITLPSAFSGVYFLLFLGVCTWWACHFPISPLGFNTLCVMVGFFTAGHLVCLYIYQVPFFQDLFPPASIWARVLGFKEIITPSNCAAPHDLILNVGHDWPVYVNPGILLLLYFTMASVLKMGSLASSKKKEVEDARSSSQAQHSAVEVELTPRLSQRQSAEDDTKQMLLPANAMPRSDAESVTVHVMSGSSQAELGAPGGENGDSPLHMIGCMILQQSYICALIAMMVWSITYHSWLTFVLLLWACLIWIVRSRHRFAMICSPFILLYGMSLCSVQYIWAMDLEPELPDRVGFMSLKQLGLERSPQPCLRLGAMLLYTLTFWLLLRQSVKEMFTRKKAATAPLLEVTTRDTEAGRNESLLKVLGERVMDFYAKYWIYVCGGMFIVVSFAGRLVGYKIVYMLLFLLCLCLYQVYYTLWRRLLKVFWWLVVAYTMLVLIAVYTFQFEDFPTYWKNFTGFTEHQLADVGLETFELSDLFTSILIPGFFLLACILQLHYFHQPFMRITDLEHTPQKDRRLKNRKEPGSKSELLHEGEGLEDEEEELETEPGDDQLEDEAVPSKWGLVVDRLMVLFKKFSEILTRVQVFIWRVLELHILKMVAFFIIWVALQELSVMNLVLVVLWSFAVPYSRFRHMASCLSTIWACIIIVCKMLYQLSIVNPIEYSSNCTKPYPNETNLEEDNIPYSVLYKAPVDPANWFGFRKDTPILGYIKNHLLVLMLLVFEATVYRHQAHYYRQQQTSPTATHTIFSEVSREHLDHSVLDCVKYFVNYWFYKFGLEICFLLTVNVIGQRMNFLVIFHGCWLVVILTSRRRAAIAKIWPKYCLFLVLFLLYQYLLCLGIPPALCIDYPWRWNTTLTINSALIKWLYLPDFSTLPNSRNLIYDFLLLLCASQQWKVFEDEKTEEWIQLAGHNTDEANPMQGKMNPVPNFINCRCYLDMLKVVVFRYQFWFVLAVLFVAGSTRISIFGLGYLLACFYFLLFGTQLIQKPAKSRLALWDCLIIYNVAVIISKNMLSLLACVFVEQMQNRFCWLIQLFSLVCTVKGYYNPKELRDDNKDCFLPVEEAGIIWDSICCFFLLLQRRVFLSHYFLHVVADQRASAQQASRGFKLFKASIVKSMNIHQEAEKKSLAQLKRQMERIRSKQKKYKEGRRSSETKEEAESIERGANRKTSKQKKKWWRPWQDHATVLHSGEYYLFESDSEEEEELQGEEQKPPRQSAFQLAYQAWVMNAKSALNDRQQHQRVLHRQEKEKARQGSPRLPVMGDECEADTTDLSVQDEELEEGDSGKSDIMQRLLEMLKFLWVLFLAMVDGATQWLNTLTKQYVNTSTVLWIERYLLTHKISQEQKPGKDISEDQRFLDSPTEETASQRLGLEELDMEKDTENIQTNSTSGCELEELLSTDHTTPFTTGYSTRTNSWERILDLDPEQDPDATHSRLRTASEILTDRHFLFEELEESQQFYSSQNRALKLLLALYNLLASNSEMVCYFIIVLNNMVTASVISLVLPILIFLWAMLSIPRPSKRFWMTAIVYTEVMVIVKYLFQFGFFPWNSYYDTKLNEGKPFFLPRILGLEKMDNYVKYDLIQLLALFFHRSLLRRYGLWDQDGQLAEKKKKTMTVETSEEMEGGPLNPDPSQNDSEGAKPGQDLVPPGSEEDEPGQDEERKPDQNQEPPPSQDTPVPPVKGDKGSSLRFRKKRKQAKESSQEKKKAREKCSERASKKLGTLSEKVKLLLLTLIRSVYKPVHEFFHNILHTEYRAATDVYALMFLTDVVDFVIVIFGYWAFGKHSAAADITSTLSEDQVPEAFLVMLLIQFSTMVIDRALYLRKTVLGKLIFQVLLLFGIHFWMFFILPAVTERMFSQNTVAQLWYFVKCIYFALSAYQIRCGYPTRILGNFLTKTYNHLNLFLFQGFRLVPFLVELRAVMDWVWTDTTLSLSDWMCVEDIYANIFIIKCSRETEKKYPQPRGQKKKKIVKYGMGGLIIFFLICIIWFPLLFISLVRSVVGVVNHPIDVTVTIKLGGYEPLFTMSAQTQSIQPYTQQDYDKLTQEFKTNPVAMQFITLYSYEDIVTANIEGSSGSVWRISPPSRRKMMEELLNSSADMTLRFTWNYQRDLGRGGTVEHTFDRHSIDLNPNDPVRKELASLLMGNDTNAVRVHHMFPNYIRAPNGAEAKPVKQLYPDDEDSYQDVTLTLIKDRSSETNGLQEWWDIHIADCDRAKEDCDVLPMVIFSDKVSPPSLGFLAGYGIMGLYLSVVLVIGKFVRGFFSEISHSIMFEELPCVDRILKLCTDIFLVRETGELELEEEMYSKLIFLYRSPETMIKWTCDKD